MFPSHIKHKTLKIVIDMNKLGPNVTHKSRWKLIVKGICLIEYNY